MNKSSCGCSCNKGIQKGLTSEQGNGITKSGKDNKPNPKSATNNQW